MPVQASELTEDQENVEHEEEEDSAGLGGGVEGSSESGAFGSMPTEEQLPGMQSTSPSKYAQVTFLILPHSCLAYETIGPPCSCCCRQSGLIPLHIGC